MTRDEAIQALDRLMQQCSDACGDHDGVTLESIYTYLRNSIPTPKVEDASELATLRAEVERLTRELTSSNDVLERIKVALNRIGVSDSYVEWAAECRAAYDERQRLQAEVERLREALTTCAVRYERYQDGTTFDILAAAYDMRGIARTALQGGRDE